MRSLPETIYSKESPAIHRLGAESHCQGSCYTIMLRYAAKTYKHLLPMKNLQWDALDSVSSIIEALTCQWKILCKLHKYQIVVCFVYHLFTKFKGV